VPQAVPLSDKRAALLDAALQVFSERGVDGVAVPEISRRASVATGTLPRYFPSKEALVNELYLHSVHVVQVNFVLQPTFRDACYRLLRNRV